MLTGFIWVHNCTLTSSTYESMYTYIIDINNDKSYSYKTFHLGNNYVKIKLINVAIYIII